MVATIQQIIGKINPKLYAKNGSELLKKYGSPDKIPAEEVEAQSINYFLKDDVFKLDSGGTEASHTLVYESSSETLEPVYFFILDLMNEFGLAPEKLVDNFVSSPGSGHFSELGQKASLMQQQGTKILGDVAIVLRGVLNIIYDLKDFRIRLQSYDDFKSKDKNKSEAARLSLKQIWIDKVDINKGHSGIKAMALGQAGFQTLLDAFLIAKDEKEADKLDLNDRIKRIVQQRVQEFNVWLNQSESELRKRYEIERNYLRSQVNSLKLYSRWAKPYLRAAQQLEMKEGGREPALVKVFNTLILELSLLGKSKLKIEEAAFAGELPADFKKMKTKRDYYSCILVDFKFRGIPQKAGQHYVFGGRTEVSFKAYTLNSDEIAKINQEIDKSDIGDVLGLIKGTTESLEQLQKEIDFFLEEKSAEEKEKEKTKDSSNPFLALFGKYDGSGKKDEKSEKKDDNKPVKKDDWIEKNHFRNLSAEKAKDTAFKLFDVYKKAHGMPSYA